MKRFVTLSAIALSVLLSSVSSVNAVEIINNTETLQSFIDPKAGGVYYTAESPGRWSDKVSSHLPAISCQRNASGLLQVQIVNDHPQDDYTHYIVKHQLLDTNFNHLAEQLFDPSQNHSPVSEFTLENYQGTIYALSFCNVHDVWLNSATT